MGVFAFPHASSLCYPNRVHAACEHVATKSERDFIFSVLARNSVTPSCCSWAHPDPAEAAGSAERSQGWAEGNWTKWWAGLAQADAYRTLSWLLGAHFGHVSFEAGRNDFAWDQGMFEGPDE